MRESKHLYTDDELEQLLQVSADQHRLYASDRIWQNIQHEIHGEQRWPALGIVAAMVVATLTALTIVVTAGDKHAQSLAPTVMQANNVTAGDANTVIAASIATAPITNATITKAQKHLDSVEALAKAQTAVVHLPQGDKYRILALMAATNNASTALYTNKRFDNFTVNESTADNFSSTAVFDRIGSALPAVTTTDVEAIAPLQTNNWHATTIVSNQLAANNTSAAIQIPNDHKKSRWQWGFHIAPSISYRLLVDENYKSFFPGNYIASPIGLNYDIDVNQVVKHRPAMGIEVGLSFAYQLNKRISLTSGLQFNMRQYNIEAFGNNFENAPIALNNNYGQAQVINTTSRYRTSIGTMPIVLQNKYQEISIPIGIRWQVLAAKQFGISVGGSVQPTYVFDKAPFVITTDYKNYADGKSLMRNWNVNTNVEALFSYTTNNTTWIVGPQIRYQQLPTFSYRYPIREHLVDYGFRIGLLQQLK